MRILQIIGTLTVAVALTTGMARADLWVRAFGTRDVPTVHDLVSCNYRSTNPEAREVTANCTSAGHINIQERWGTNVRECRVGVWYSGMLRHTWHANIGRNDGGLCTMSWHNENTVYVFVHN